MAAPYAVVLPPFCFRLLHGLHGGRLFIHLHRVRHGVSGKVQKGTERPAVAGSVSPFRSDCRADERLHPPSCGGPDTE